jgi:hypothetical protein
MSRETIELHVGDDIDVRASGYSEWTVHYRMPGKTRKITSGDRKGELVQCTKTSYHYSPTQVAMKIAQLRMPKEEFVDIGEFTDAITGSLDQLCADVQAALDGKEKRI